MKDITDFLTDAIQITVVWIIILAIAIYEDYLSRSRQVP